MFVFGIVQVILRSSALSFEQCPHSMAVCACALFVGIDDRA